jgi:glycosyltransferase involved in cell wall biosynthesis
MILVTNAPRFPPSWTSSSGVDGTSIEASSVADFLREAGRPDAVLLINCNPALTFALAARLWHKKSPPLVSLDLVLRRPAGWRARVAHPLKRRLLRRVNHFIHYFRDLRQFDRIWGVGPHNSSFVPFKPNIRLPQRELADTPGEYVLCFGRSLRDYDTFFAAVERLPYPAAIAQPDVAQLREHGARFTRPLDRLPPNVTILPDDGSEHALVDIIRRARLFVVPVLATSFVASGISTSLDAMLLGRCVIGSEGPGMSDIYSGEILTVPPEDAEALAAMIRRAWEDEELRRRTAEAGRRYALSVGGEAELYQRVIDDVVSWRQAQS